jgi:exonuclease III
VGDLNTPFSPIKHPDKKLKKDVIELNNTLDDKDLTDIYRVFHSTTADYTFFSAAHGTFSKIEHILGHKANLNKYKKIKTAPYNS